MRDRALLRVRPYLRPEIPRIVFIGTSALVSIACALTVPGGPSIACSSAAAIAWDPSFAQRADPSGRAVAGVHVAATAPA